MLDTRQRLRRLISANMEIAGDLSMPLVIRRVLESACELVDAHYGALAVFDADGSPEHFLRVGADTVAVEAIGDLPPGSDFEALSEGPHPARIAHIADDDRSPGRDQHSPTGGSLGLPIRSRNKILASLYLSDRDQGSFTAADEELLTAFAAAAGLAIEDAQLYEQAQDGQRRLEASAEISGILLSDDSGSDPLQVIVEKICDLVDADLGTLVVPAPEPDQLEVAVATGFGADTLRGMTYPAPNSIVRLAMDSARGIRVASVGQQHRFQVHLSRVVELGPVIAVPLSGRSGPQGALVVGRRVGRQPFSAADLDLAAAFAVHAAIARELAAARADQQRLALLKSRAQVARDLHDQVIQRLFAAGLTMQSVAVTAATPELTDRLEGVIENLNETIRQIRTSIFQLQSSDAAPSGIQAIVVEIIDQLAPDLGFVPTVRFSGPIDTVVAAAELDAVAAVVREAVTNVAKHAQATRLDVELSVDLNQISVDVSDNGVGLGLIDSPRRSGLDNLSRRADIWGGSLTLTANEPHGTRLVWSIPIQ